MLTAEQMTTLKRGNVSVDADKTKERLKTDFSSCKNKKKDKIIELSGLTRAAFYRAYASGASSARVVLSMAQILKVSPFYYTGELNKRQKLEPEFIIFFLQKHGYTELATELLADKPPDDTAVLENESDGQPETPIADDDEPEISVSDDSEPETPVAEDAQPETPDSLLIEFKAKDIRLIMPDTVQMQDAVLSLGEDEAITLLKALFIRSKSGGQAGQLGEIVKRCLLY